MASNGASLRQLNNINTTTNDDDNTAQLLDSVPELNSLFSIIKRIGHGTFSSVYLGYSRQKLSLKLKHYAIKQIIPTSHPSRIFMELKCLKVMGGEDNIVEATLCLRNLNNIVLIMPYFPHDSFADYVGTLTTEELCDYLLNLFVSLKKVHSFNIIHRDIKPSNFLYCRKYRRYALIDFGLAQEEGESQYKSQSSQALSSVEVGERRMNKTLNPKLTFSRQFKRKLTISNASSSDALQSSAKRQRVGSSLNQTASSSPSSCLTPLKINPNVNTAPFARRSPRKFISSLRASDRKENSPLGNDGNRTGILNDSPSKHTRLAESVRLGTLSQAQIEKSNCVSRCLTPELKVRKSPRKSLNNLRWKTSGTRGDGISVTTPKESPSLAASLSAFSMSGALHSGSRDSSRRSSLLQEVKTECGRTVLRSSRSCSCYGNAKVCPICIGRRNQHAPRAGTPGYRAPEVLLRYPHQTRAVDMWSAGVMMLNLLSGRYPFFTSADDLSSLAEIISVLGSKAIKETAENLDKLFKSSEDVPAVDLKEICEQLRNKCLKDERYSDTRENRRERVEDCTFCYKLNCTCLNNNDGQCTNTSLLETSVPQNLGQPKEKLWNNTKSNYPSVVYDLLYRLLDPNPQSRISAAEALSHPFIIQYSKKGDLPVL